ncbi:MAG: hypothetical protein JHC93_04765 [Parachlamydiales bacterium]|nr:hypothetical protein [Parachlamydiales bacterium]
MISFLKRLYFFCYLNRPWRLKNELFDRQYAYPNLKLLIKLKSNEWLTATKQAQLIKHQGSIKHLANRFINLLSFNRLKFRTQMAIYFSMALLCHDGENPLDPIDLLERIKMKQRTFKKLNAKINSIQGCEQNFDGLIDSYTRRSLVQYRILKEVIYWTDFKGKNLLAKKAQEVIASGSFPKKVGGRTSGAYFILNKLRDYLFIFKPFDEEIFGPNNTTVRSSLGCRLMRKGVLSGESCHREVAAYIVDHYLGLNIVPKTVYAKLSHIIFHDNAEGNRLVNRRLKLKRGSLQQYIPNTRHLKPANHIQELQLLSPISQEKLFVLDIIIGSVDRHYENILTDGQDVVAIDNGLSFVDRHEQYFWIWYHHFDHAKSPLSASMQACILDLDVEKLILCLKKSCHLDERCYQRLKERVALLVAGVKKQLAPTQIRHLLTDDYLKMVLDLNNQLQTKAEQAVDLYLQRSKNTRYLTMVHRAIPTEVC